MRPHRALVPHLSPEIELRGREARHLLEVLRARPGDLVTVFDGKGLEGRAVVEAVEAGILRLRLEQSWEVSREVGVPVELYVALLKGDALADVVRAATELGVTRIVPTITTHSVAKEMGGNKLERLRRVAVEAAKQSGRTVVPVVAEPIPLKQIPQVEQGFVAHVGSELRVREVLEPGKPISLATGPEGGFSPQEVDFLVGRGFQPVTLGRRILRAETAPLALLALVTAGEGL
ncbi:16S rRNA (uracil(1498)-N(3))-methyltransferase [Calidithermus timidus]|jgi:16S rRNA (uracil1498-N3)-methyltransferase|uniref:16S rRNA (uracil(1498)-N(3))-methyltransferase n=1 Tax=Calidithermus timidus TaxID=307124 RepID=UPI00036F8E53|nr:16S rRNA (uracil(1498)-N(3))-methyltransferase [Calidithermus timidus]